MALPYQRLGTAYTVSIGSASTRGARRVPVGINFVRLTASVDCWVAIGHDPTADTAASTFLPARWPDTFRVNAGDVVAVIADNPNALAGVLSVTEMTQ